MNITIETDKTRNVIISLNLQKNKRSFGNILQAIIFEFYHKIRDSPFF
jgi:hypothetical protein